jgi:hypothetical protein
MTGIVDENVETYEIYETVRGYEEELFAMCDDWHLAVKIVKQRILEYTWPYFDSGVECVREDLDTWSYGNLIWKIELVGG